MCDTSNRPSAERTALCSLIVPAAYETGMCQPPKSISFAPSRLWASHSGVFFGSIAANTTSAHEDVLVGDSRIARPSAVLEMRTPVADQGALLPPAEARA